VASFVKKWYVYDDNILKVKSFIISIYKCHGSLVTVCFIEFSKQEKKLIPSFLEENF